MADLDGEKKAEKWIHSQYLGKRALVMLLGRSDHERRDICQGKRRMIWKKIFGGDFRY